MSKSDTHTLGAELEYSKITDQIYLGTNQCCTTHFDDRLKAEGITAEISLEKERLDAPFGVDLFLWLPVFDNTAPAPDLLALGVSTIDQLVQAGRKVYVHCRLGHGRAPTLVAAYLIRHHEMSVEEAIAYIKERRPVIHPVQKQLSALKSFWQNLNSREID